MTNQNWVFLSGLTRGTPHWGDFPKIFKNLHPKINSEFLEIPGNGSLYLEETPINPEKVIQFLKNRSQFCQKNVPFNICGISLGGMIALKWAELYPQDICSVVIINSSLNQCSPFYQRLRLKNYYSILKGLFHTNSMYQEELILKITSNKFEETKRYLNLFSNFSKDHKVSKANFTKQLLLANNVLIHHFPNIPLKVICSKNDRLVNSICSDKIAIALNGLQIIHPTAGHDLPLDEPKWLSEHLVTS